MLIGGALPIATVSIAWAATGLWTRLPDQLPSHWSGSGVGSIAPVSEVVGNWVVFGYASALCTIGITFGILREIGWTAFGRRAVSICVGFGALGAIAYRLLPHPSPPADSPN